MKVNLRKVNMQDEKIVRDMYDEYLKDTSVIEGLKIFKSKGYDRVLVTC